MAISCFPPRAYYIRKEANRKKSEKKEKQEEVSDGSDEKKLPSSSSSEEQRASVTANDVDVENRHFVLDMKPLGASDFEVGTVDSITEEVKKFLMEFFRSEGNTDAPFPGDNSISLRLQYNENLNCPFLVSWLAVTSKYGNMTRGNIAIFALSENVQDILQILLKMEISSFQLEDVHEKYVAEVREFLSSNPFLRKLSIGEDYLKKDRELDRELFWDIFRSSASLSTLEFARRKTTNTKLDQSLKVHLSHINEAGQSLTTLDLTQAARLEPVIIDGLVEGFAKSPKIKILNMSRIRHDFLGLDFPMNGSDFPIDIAKLAKVLRTNDTLEEWNVGGRTVANFQSILQIAKLLKHNKCLKRLDLRTSPRTFQKCWVHPDTWIPVGKALAINSSLQYLDLTGHRISRESWKAFGESLKVNKSLLTLKAKRPYRQWREKETDILLPVFAALHENRTLQSLELSNFEMSDSFASLEVLESILIENGVLKSLALNGSEMTDEGAAILSRRLPEMKGIETLSLCYHECTVKGAQAFAEGMKKNYNIVSVNFGGHYHGGASGGSLRPALGADGFEKEFHEIEYYARMNRKGRRCIGSEIPVGPSLWPLVLKKAQKKEEPIWRRHKLASSDVRKKDYFAGDHDTSIDAVFYLLRDVVRIPLLTAE